MTLLPDPKITVWLCLINVPLLAMYYFQCFGMINNPVANILVHESLATSLRQRHKNRMLNQRVISPFQVFTKCPLEMSREFVLLLYETACFPMAFSVDIMILKVFCQAVAFNQMVLCSFQSSPLLTVFIVFNN